MPDTLTALADLTASSFAEVNLTDYTFQAITSGTGIEATHGDVGVMIVKNTTAGGLTFSITIPTPLQSGLDLIGKTVTDQSYTVPANKTILVANMGAYQDTSSGSSSQKITVDASGAGLQVLFLKPVNPSYKGQATL